MEICSKTLIKKQYFPHEEVTRMHWCLALYIPWTRRLKFVRSYEVTCVPDGKQFNPDLFTTFKQFWRKSAIYKYNFFSWVSSLIDKTTQYEWEISRETREPRVIDKDWLKQNNMPYAFLFKIRFFYSIFPYSFGNIFTRCYNSCNARFKFM